MKNLDMQSVPTTGTRLNKYILTEEIGRGGHGIVYRAYHEENVSEAVAVKIIENSGNIDSLLIEPELLSRLNHPNIIRLKDFFIHAGKLVLVTEYIDGIDLQSYLSNRGKLTAEEVGKFLTQMADALNHAHTNNIIHRDIKLSNVLFTGEAQNPRFVLVDFGISRMTEGIQTVKRVAGTYYYMAPEQLRGRPCEQSDLWSLGVCAYTLLTGIKPFEGKTEEDLSKRILLSIPKSPGEVLERVDSELEDIIFHLLEKQLINRIASASDLLEELKIWSRSISLVSSQDRISINKSVSIAPAANWEQKNLQDIRKSWRFFWIFAFLAILPNLIGHTISLTGLIFFYLGQLKSNIFRTLIAIFFMVIGYLITNFIFLPFYESILQNIIVSSGVIGIIFIYAFAIASFVAIIIAVHYLAKVKRLKERLFLYKALRESQSAEKITQLLKNFIDICPGNMNIRQKYIELLLLSNQFKEAVVESKLSLEIDPYNFGLSLLLANSYFEVGLYEECIEICNGYLAIAG